MDRLTPIRNAEAEYLHGGRGVAPGLTTNFPDQSKVTIEFSEPFGIYTITYPNGKVKQRIL
jgi:hypothetical protein